MVLRTRALRARVGGAPWLSKSTYPRKFGNHKTVHRPPTADRPSVRTTGQPMFTLTLLASLGTQEKTNCTSMINWQLSKQGIRWPVSPDRTAGSSVDPSRSSICWSYPLTNYQFQMIAGSSLFFPRIHIKYVVFMSLWPRKIRILISNWPRKRKLFSQFFLKYRRGRPYLPMVRRWSRSTSNFYTLIGQNLTGEFMRKNYAASWK